MYILNSDSSYVRDETVESVQHKINILLRINYISYLSTFREKSIEFFAIFWPNFPIKFLYLCKEGMSLIKI